MHEPEQPRLTLVRAEHVFAPEPLGAQTLLTGGGRILWMGSGDPPLALLRTNSGYPAAPAEMDLRALPELASRFGVVVGLSPNMVSLAWIRRDETSELAVPSSVNPRPVPGGVV